jgi:CHAT domain-containing protein
MDIYQLHINPDLVVLSACESSKGAKMAGEGLITLSRAFLYAGARRVIATLWLVKDAPAEQLTTAMYQRLLGKQRLSPASALRQTQLAFWSAGLSPRKWAAFTLVGDWD